VARSRRYGTPLSLVLFDIDRLRAINERYGQPVGDEAIRRVCQVLQAQVRKEDVCGRMGENTFAVLLPGTRHRGAAVFANKVRGDAEAGILVSAGGADVPVRLSAGISSVRGGAAIEDGETLLGAAEAALAEAKRRGGNRVYIDEQVLRSERRVVVIADPDRTLLDLAEDLLSVDDYRVVRAESAATLLAALDNRRPDLLVVDLDLARGQADLFERIGAMFPDARVPIIGLASRPDAEPDRLGRLGLDRFITKPFSVSVLRSVARELIESEPARTV
jgi:diguanylate cyclase (GGDEF)-like protein